MNNKKLKGDRPRNLRSSYLSIFVETLGCLRL